MSTNTTFTTITRSCAAELKRSLPVLDREREALVNGLNSARIADLAAHQASLPVTSIESVSQMWTELTESIPGGWEQLPEKARQAFADADGSLRSASASTLPVDIVTLDQLRDTIDVATGTAVREIAQVERLVHAEIVELSLPALGYEVIRVDGEHVTSFEATREHNTLLIEVQDGAVMIEDYALLSDDSCDTAQAELHAEYASYGLEAEAQERTLHRDPRGGWLIAEAGRARMGSLAAGNAHEGDRRFREGARTLFASARAATRRVTEGGAR